MQKLPHVTPLKPTRLRQRFNHPDWVFELKHDGFRAAAYISDDRSRLVHGATTTSILYAKHLSPSIGRAAIIGHPG
jgi:hypothetical protein